MTTSSRPLSDSATPRVDPLASPSTVPPEEAAEPLVVPVLEESAVFAKRRVDQGGWRVNKQVTTRDETIDVPLHSLQVTIERRVVDQLLPSMEAPLPRQEGDTWILPVVEEVLISEKRLRIKEEIRITHTQSTRHEPQRFSLRSEEVSIDRLEPGHPLGTEPTSPPGPSGPAPMPSNEGHKGVETMSSVLVGMFDTRAAAEEARTTLMDAGLSPGQVTWNAESGDATSSTSTSTAAPEKDGMFSRFFHSIFGSDDDTVGTHGGSYQEAFRRGGFGLTVTATSDADIDRAADILDDCGAFDVDERSEQWKSEGWAGAPATAVASGASGLGPSDMSTTLSSTDRATTAANLATGGTQKLNIVEESLAVGKRTVGRGGVRVYGRVVEVPVQETVHLREEHAEIQRREVDRPATEADFAAFQEGSIEVRSSAEEAVVGKTARVVGEVEVGTRVTERDEVVRDTVRKTEVDVEQIAVTAGTTATTGSSSLTGGAAGTGLGLATGGIGALDTGSTLGRSGSTLTGGSANLDPITGEPGAHPVGTGVGAVAGGVAAGAAVGTVAGPIGTAVGAAVGAVAGGLAGKGVAEKVDPTTSNRKPV